MKTCIFIGHYVLPKGDELADLKKLTREKIESLYRQGCDTFLVSFAHCGFNRLAAEEVAESKKSGLPVKLVIILPFKGYNSFNAVEKEKMERILMIADEIVYAAQKPDYLSIWSTTEEIMFEKADRAIVNAAWLDPAVMILIEKCESKGIKQYF